MFQSLFSSEPAAGKEPEEQSFSFAKIAGWLRTGAAKAAPVLKKAATATLAGAKKAGAAGVALTKTAAGKVREEVAKRRGGESATAAADETAAEKAAEG